MSNKAEDYIGEKVKLIIDRPIDSKHPEYAFIYGVNYGYVPGTKAPDGEEIDAYYIGKGEPLEKAEGLCVAVIKRKYDDDDKLVVVSEEKKEITDKEIKKLVDFQEKWFEYVIVR